MQGQMTQTRSSTPSALALRLATAIAPVVAEAVADAARARGPKLLTTAEAAETLRVSATTLKSLMRRGEIASVHVGARRLVPFDALEAFIAEARRAGSDGRT
jgi:excisionase family DNA binding protein